MPFDSSDLPHPEYQLNVRWVFWSPDPDPSQTCSNEPFSQAKHMHGIIKVFTFFYFVLQVQIFYIMQFVLCKHKPDSVVMLWQARRQQRWMQASKITNPWKGCSLRVRDMAKICCLFPENAAQVAVRVTSIYIYLDFSFYTYYFPCCRLHDFRRFFCGSVRTMIKLTEDFSPPIEQTQNINCTF